MKKTIIVILAVVLVLGFYIGMLFITEWLFSAQYNSNGISHFLVITIDENQPKELVGRLDDHDIYVERLNLEGTNFRSVEAENVSIKDALEKEIVSIEDWRKHAFRIINDEDIEILRFDNYEIEVTANECTIRPITY